MLLHSYSDSPQTDTFKPRKPTLPNRHLQEASSKVKTVHTGFFANQGSVATIGSPSDSGSVGSGAGGKGEDSDVIVRPKKKKVCACV